MGAVMTVRRAHVCVCAVARCRDMCTSSCGHVHLCVHVESVSRSRCSGRHSHRQSGAAHFLAAGEEPTLFSWYLLRGVAGMLFRY